MERSTAAVLAGFRIERAVRDADFERVRNEQLEEANAALRVANEEKDRSSTQLRDQQGDVARAARTDQLTGLANRRTLEHEIEPPLQRGAAVRPRARIRPRRRRRPRSSTTRRARTGLATRSSARLRRSSAPRRATSTSSRAGRGEEFAVCFPSTTRATAAAACERIREVVELTDWSRIHPGVEVTVCIGLAGSGEAESAPRPPPPGRRAALRGEGAGPEPDRVVRTATTYHRPRTPRACRSAESTVIAP